MKKQIKKENNRAIALPLEEQNAFDAFTASTMMVIMKKPFFDGSMSSPAAPGGGLPVV
jgi:hypothetical protein